jgi:hypothetical protein
VRIERVINHLYYYTCMKAGATGAARILSNELTAKTPINIIILYLLLSSLRLPL